MASASSAARVLVLGASGMLGHQMLRLHGADFEVYGTLRSAAARDRCAALLPDFPVDHLVTGIEATDLAGLRALVGRLRPDAIVNCVGVVKQSDAIADAVASIELNALLPHRLAQLCAEHGARLIHFSTDCVFSGRAGRYTEADTPDPIDFYGRGKLLGEATAPGCLTLRTSIVGWELEHQRSLLGWFASQRGRAINGFRRAIYSGLTTREAVRVVGHVIASQPQLTGLYHVASAPISKFELLSSLRDALGWSDVEIRPDDTFICDRSLLADRFAREAGWTASSWGVMIAELARERPLYEAMTKPEH